MKINFRILADELSNDYKKITISGGNGFDLLQVQLWDETQTHVKNALSQIDPQCLYYTYSSGLPSQALKGVCYLLFQQPTEEWAFYNYIVVEDCSDIRTLLIQIQNIFIRLLSWQTQILRISSKGSDFQQLLEISSPVFGNNVSLNSLVHNKIFTTDTITDIPDSRWTQILSVYLGGKSDYPILNSHFLSKFHTNRFPSLLDFGDGRNYLCYNLSDRGFRAGTLTVQENNTQFLYSHGIYLQELGECILRIYNRIQYLPDDEMRHTLHALLSGENISEQYLEKICLKHNWQESGHTYRVSVISAANREVEKLFKNNLLFYRNMIANLYPNNIILLDEDSIVMIRDLTVNDELEAGEGANSFDKLQLLLKAINACMGSSMPFSRLRNTRVFYEQAKTVAKGISPSAKGIHEYSNYMTYDLISNFAQSHPLKHYIHPDVKKLAQWDSEKNADLLYSLYVYLLNDRSYKACSEKSLVHRNTFVYRIQKALELITCDLCNEETRMSILLSIHMYWYLYPEVKPVNIYNLVETDVL